MKLVGSRDTLYGWWFLAIALGFGLLALSQLIDRGPWWGIVLRLVIAAGFALLAAAYLRRKAP